ncbi:malonate decarboxylase subunit epsilon [Acidicapsa ligni]|uniref:malonate decarboxylase subunit epsilon n=1 Tax=Acidicapsa ligni TaxID=542300 RepID=UPI0021E0F0F6|nr:malonate decarboxylase subunit epsilon [Acidicapsa ligni]
MKTAILFPGQGSQKPQMLHELVQHPAIAETLSEVSEVLSLDVRTLDTPEALQSAVSVQLAILTASVATARALQQSGLEPLAVAGLSVGAFSAAVAAGSISLPDAVQLVRFRAEEMERMYPAGYGLSAIVGLSETQVAKLVEAENSKEHPVFVGNINAPRQIVIAGSNEGMELVLQKARAQGARKAERLDVPVPSHCALLQPVADSLRLQLQSISVKDPKPIYLANVTARAVRTAQGVARDLADNIAHGVRWYDATTVARELGCELFLEVPPGHTLSDLAQENLPEIKAHTITPETFNRLLNLAKNEATS